MNTITMRRAKEKDVRLIAGLNSKVFLGDRNSEASALEWVTCWFRSYPLYQYFILELDGVFTGYAGWQMHGGFKRPEPVIELDQIGVDPDKQSLGLGPQLIDYSIKELMKWLVVVNDRIESHVTFVVWGYTLNLNAMSAYGKKFIDGSYGFRLQFGERAENMFRMRVPVVRPVRS